MLLGRRDIKNLEVYCRMKESGCHWKGILSDLENHHKTCEFVMVYCPKRCYSSEIECIGTKVKRKDIDYHLKELCPKRDYSCVNCEEKSTYEYITGGHLDVCPNKTICCSNDECVATFMLKDEEEHRRTCDYEVLNCQYDSFGCPVKRKRIDITQHIKTDGKKHISLAQGKIRELKEKVDELKKEIIELEAGYTNVLVKEQHLTFRIQELNNKIKKNLKFESNAFYVANKDGMKVLICVDFSQDGCIYASIKELDAPRFPQTDFRLSIQLLNQVEDSHSNFKAFLDIQAAPAKLISFDTMEQNPNYMFHNCIYLKVCIVPIENFWLSCTH